MLPKSFLIKSISLFLFCFFPFSVSHGTKPTESLPSLFIEDLTWTEVRDALNHGYDTVIIPSGGTEQNGPHMILGKHNYIIRYSAEQIAKRLGTALIAPVIAYVPEGEVDDPQTHMAFPGTVTLSQKDFQDILESAAKSFLKHGFKYICFIGDSGGNQHSQILVAKKLDKKYQKQGQRIFHIGDYYDFIANGEIEWLKSQGESETTIGIHAGIRDTSELMAVHPTGIREAERMKDPGPAEGVLGTPSRASLERGQKLMEMKIQAAYQQIHKLRSD